MSTAYSPSTRLNPVQISLLRLFDRGMSDDEVLTIKRLLVKHYAAQLKEEAANVVAEKGYTAADFEAMLNGDLA